MGPVILGAGTDGIHLRVPRGAGAWPAGEKPVRGRSSNNCPFVLRILVGLT